MGQFYTFEGDKELMSAWSPPRMVPFGGSVTAGSPILTVVALPAGIQVGDLIVGLDLAPNSRVVSTTPTTITVDKNAINTQPAENMVDISGGFAALDFTVHLLTGVIPQSPQTKFTDLTEANFDGYAPIPVTGLSPVLQDGSYARVAAQCMTWIPADFVVPNTISGLAWTTPDGVGNPPNLIATETFAVPIPLTVPGDGVQVTPILSQPFDVTAGPASPIVM